MPDASTIAVIETDTEVEARIYEALLSDAGIFAQVREAGDPITTNIMWQIALPHYQVVVPAELAERAKSVVAEYRREMEPAAGADTVESREPPESRQNLLRAGRLLLWIVLAVIVLAVLFEIFKGGLP